MMSCTVVGTSDVYQKASLTADMMSEEPGAVPVPAQNFGDLIRV